jgi:hypothetical protein
MTPAERLFYFAYGATLMASAITGLKLWVEIIREERGHAR